MFQAIVLGEIETRILCSVTPPPPRKPGRLWDNVEKNSRTGQAADDRYRQYGARALHAD
jgi:hypothetical protein